ncbi:WD40-repeat-containing domain protein [Lactarius psammicola]|nr:WD40-repeat-containing domain protein [Lactarius psammicola]
MSSTSALPLLLPTQHTKTTSYPEWKPQRYLQPPQPPVVDDQRIQDLELAVQRQLLDGKALKKTRPRRTVDYAGGMGRWALFRKLQPNPRYVPYIRPSPPYIIDLLPPKAYPDNASTSLCTKFVHTSTNKIRCPVNAVTWTPEGRRILTGSTSGEFTAWNGLTFNFETILQAHDTAIRALTFNHAWHLHRVGRPVRHPHREAVRGLSFSPDDARFATASDDSTVRVWSFAESREERVLTGHGWDVKCVEWHPTMGLLVSGSKDNLIKFWDPRTGTALTTLHQHKNTIQALSWAPHGNLLASASRDQTVRVFDIRSMKEWVVLRGHKKEVCSLAWHPVHPILVSGGSEGAILHWDLSSPTAGTPMPTFPMGPHTTIPHSQLQSHGNNSSGTTASSATLSAPAPQVPPRATLSQAHDSNVWALTFHPLGHLLVSASNDHTTRFWARERPGDAASSFAPGGAKPAAAQPDDDAYDGQDDDDDALAVPGFGSSAAGAWWGAAGAVDGIAGSSGGGGGSGVDDVVVPGFGGGGGANIVGAGGGGSDVPGLGSAGAGGALGSGAADGQGQRGGQHADDWAYRRTGGDGGGRGGGAGGYEASKGGS